MAERKSVTELNATDVQLLRDSFWELKRERNAADGLSTYDRYVVIHATAMGTPTPYQGDFVGFRNRNAAHRGPVFLPWHREFLRRLELDLQRVSGNPNLGIPYWEWDKDEANSDSSTVWDVVGPIGLRDNNFRVLSGPFAFDWDNLTNPSNWTIVDAQGRPNGGLIRTGGWSPNPNTPRRKLPASPDIKWAKAFMDYDSDPWNELSGLLGEGTSFRNALEGWIVEAPQDGTNPKGARLGNGLHNRVHNWMGGSMGPGTSPNDPIFFLHHAYVDKIWADWQVVYPDAYSPITGGPFGHNWLDVLIPWNGVEAPEIVTVQVASDLGSARYIDKE